MITVYTFNLPLSVSGRANGPIIRIKPQYSNDKDIHAHKELHIKQWRFWVLLSAIAAAWLAYMLAHP